MTHAEAKRLAIATKSLAEHALRRFLSDMGMGVWEEEVGRLTQELEATIVQHVEGMGVPS